jgi:hypothetical protein
MSERDSKEPPSQALLRRIMKENPNGNKASWRDQFRREIMDDPDLRRAIAEEAFEGLLKDLRRSRAN